MADFARDEQKRLSNIAKHGIDFRRATEIWDGPVLLLPARTVGGETRRLACGWLGGDVISVVYVERAGAIRIISARRARDYEQEAFEDYARHG